MQPRTLRCITSHSQPSASSPSRIASSRRLGTLCSAFTPIRSHTVSRLSSKPGRRRPPSVLARPLVADLLGRAERERVVDERRAAQTLGRQQADAAVDARHAAAVLVEPVEPPQLRAVEVLLGEVAPGLQHDHVEAGLGEHRRGGAAARARADHDHVAVERGVLADGERLDRRRRAGSPGGPAAGIADRVPDRVRGRRLAVLAVVGQQRALAQRLEGGAPLAHAAVGPGQHHPLALVLRQRGEAVSAAAGDRAQQARVPQAEQLRHLLALGGARVARHEREQRLGHADLGRRRHAVAARREGVADRIERGAAFGESAGGSWATLCHAAPCQARSHLVDAALDRDLHGTAEGLLGLAQRPVGVELVRDVHEQQALGSGGARVPPASAGVRWPRTPVRSGRGRVASISMRSASLANSVNASVDGNRRRRSSPRRLSSGTPHRERLGEVRHRLEADSHRADLELARGPVLARAEGLLDQVLVAPRADDAPEGLGRSRRRVQPGLAGYRCPASGRPARAAGAARRSAHTSTGPGRGSGRRAGARSPPRRRRRSRSAGAASPNTPLPQSITTPVPSSWSRYPEQAPPASARRATSRGRSISLAEHAPRQPAQPLGCGNA